MKYGIIGTGWISRSFIDGARLACDAEITAVYSRTAERGRDFALDNNIPSVYTDLEEFAKGDFDAVYIASPNAFHAKHSLFMLESGKHVICEKPLAVTPEEIEQCAAKAREKGLIYMEAIMHMHSPDREALKDALGELGVITSAHFDFSQLSSKYPAYERGETPNIFNPKLATGCLMDLGVYCVYPALDLFGLPDKITADAAFLRTGADGSGNASFNYGDKLVTLTYSKTGQDRCGSQICGDRGTVTVGSISKLQDMEITDNSGNSRALCPDRSKEEIMGFEAFEFEKFIVNPDDEKYALCSRMSLEVSRVMKQIREICNIRFD